MSDQSAPNPNYQDLVNRVMALPGFTKEAGFRLRSVTPGAASLDVVPRPGLCQFNGFLHGGVLTALCDHAAGAACTSQLPEGRIGVTVELKINFLAPARGDLIVADARVVHAAGSLAVVQAEGFAEDADQRTRCAIATVTLRSVPFSLD